MALPDPIPRADPGAREPEPMVGRGRPGRALKLLSVCAPVFNEEELVDVFYERATAALAGFEYELIIVNDGSGDGTGAIAWRTGTLGCVSSTCRGTSATRRR